MGVDWLHKLGSRIKYFVVFDCCSFVVHLMDIVLALESNSATLGRLIVHDPLRCLGKSSKSRL